MNKYVTLQETMEADWAKWVGRNRALKNADEEIDFQTDYVLDIARCKSWWMIVMIMWENYDYDKMQVVKLVF